MQHRSLPARIALAACLGLWSVVLVAEPGSPPSDQPGHYPAMGGPVMDMGMGWGGPSGHGGEHWKGLNLTPEQQQAMQDVTRAYRPRWQELRTRGEAIREKLTAVSPDDSGYATATESASQDAAALAADVVTLMSQMRAEVHAILTPEQRAQLQQQMEQRRQRWDAWRSRERPAS